MIFTIDQVKRLANILDNAGQVIFASVIIPLIFGTVDFTVFGMLLWILAMALCWWISLRLERLSS